MIVYACTWVCAYFDWILKPLFMRTFKIQSTEYNSNKNIKEEKL